MRFRVFIVLAIATAIALGGYSIARVEHSIHQQGIELAQERLNACKFKLYDVATGSEGRAIHSQKGSPQYNPRQAEIIAGALRVVLTIPSAKECIPVIKEAIVKQHPEGLTPKVEHELLKLAVESEASSLPPVTSSGKSTPSRPHKEREQRRESPKSPTSPKKTTPPTPPGSTSPSQPTPKELPATKGSSSPPTTTTTTVEPPTITVPATPPVTTPTVEVPPITTPPVKTPEVKIEIPPIEVPPIKIELPICTPFSRSTVVTK